METALPFIKKRTTFSLCFFLLLSLGLTACNNSSDDSSSNTSTQPKLNCAP